MDTDTKPAVKKKRNRHVWGRQTRLVDGKNVIFCMTKLGVTVRVKHSRKEAVIVSFTDIFHASNGQFKQI